MVRQEEEEEDIVCLDESFFINDNYQLTTFTFGSHVLQLFCLQSASRQLVWPGAMLLNDYLSKNAEILQGCSMIELGSGVGITGMLCSRFCHQILLTDHNEEVLKILRRNIELNLSSESPSCCAADVLFHILHAALEAEKLEWGNSDQINRILQKYPGGFDLILGADICFQQSSVPLLFDTVQQLLCERGSGHCKFILAYVSRAKMMDLMVIAEATQHGMLINEVAGTRSVVGNLEGVIFEITLC
ncbi:protein N-lysine methyltransferase METTL21A isoform X2 [Durio zibethinus]|uniref:Protein N-lysine methyltransferase METTL21A isoform X2 n=1 Tax=Durio zibethinus TaxID=66656 RepID=A0A6P5ZUN8_DURZI|nr:protein N-lysine methyltransferase METTL21A isoform X2 [Durio zibethinus]